MRSFAIAFVTLVALATLAMPAQAQAPTIVLSTSSVNLDEGGLSVTYSVSLSHPSATEVKVTIVRYPEITVSPTILTFAPGSTTPQNVRVSALEDSLVEGTETLNVHHDAESANPSYNGQRVTLATTVTDNDRGVVLLHTGGTTAVSEAGATDTFTVALGAAPTSTVTVRLAPDPQLSVSGLTLTFSTSNWKTPRSVTVAAANDQVAEGTRTRLISATVSSGDAGYQGVAVTPLPVGITDNDVAGFRYTVGGSTLANNVLPTTLAANEGAGTSFGVRLNSQPTAPVTLAFTSATGLSATPSSVTFTASNWGTSQTVGLLQAQDDVDQGSTYTSTLQQATTTSDAGYASAPGPIGVTITDNDVANVLLAHTGGSTTITEGGAGDSVTLVLATRPTAAVTLALTAPAGVALSPASVTFEPALWSTAQTVALTATDDGTAELPQSVTLTATATSADAIYNAMARTLPVSVLDDDGVLLVQETGGSTAPSEGAGGGDSFTVRLIGSGNGPSSPVTVTLTASDPTQFQVNGGTTATLTFDPSSGNAVPSRCSSGAATSVAACPWDVPQTVQVTAVADNKVDGPKTGQITLRATSSDAAYNNQVSRPVAVTALDSDVAGFIFDSGAVGVLPTVAVTEGTSNDSYTVRLSSIPTGTVTVTLAPSGGAQTSATSLTFSPSTWSTVQTVTVSVARDNIDQGTTYSASIAQSVSSPDPLYNSIPGPVAVTVTDHADDIAGWRFATTGAEGNRDALPSALAVNEGADTTYKVRPNTKPVAPVTVTLAGTGGAVPDPATLTFTAADWQTAQVVTVRVPQDSVDRGTTYAATVQQSASSTDPRYVAIPGPIALTVTDDDVAALRLLHTSAATSVKEGEAPDTIDVKLATQPTADVVVALTVGSEATLSPSSLTFTPANWDQAQAVTVTAVDDSEAEFTESPSVSATATSADALYSGKTGSLVATVLDNDGVLIVSHTDGATTVQEGGATDTYTIRLIDNPTAEVRVTLTSPSGQVRFDGSPSKTLVFLQGEGLLPAPCPSDPTANCRWDQPRTVTVSAAADTLVEGTITAIVNHPVSSTDSRFNGVPSASLAVTVQDDDRGLIVKETNGGTNVVEGGAGDSYSVALSVPPTFSVAVVVNAPSRLAVDPGTLLFDSESWDQPQDVQVSAVNDNLDQPAETLVLQHSSSSADPTYQDLTASVTVQVAADDDVAGVRVQHTGTETRVTEGGAGDTFTVRILSQPTAPVIIRMTPDSQVSISATTLTFTAANWNVAQTVTVNAVNDAANEADTHNGGVYFGPVESADPAYGGGSVLPLPVLIVDND